MTERPGSLSEGVSGDSGERSWSIPMDPLRFDDICEPLCVLPAQLAASPRPASIAPELDLMFAVLVSTLEEILELARDAGRWEKRNCRYPEGAHDHVRRGRAWVVVPEPVGWMYAREVPKHLYGYQAICDRFGVDAERLREYVRELLEGRDLGRLRRLCMLARSRLDRVHRDAGVFRLAS